MGLYWCIYISGPWQLHWVVVKNPKCAATTMLFNVLSQTNTPLLSMCLFSSPQVRGSHARLQPYPVVFHRIFDYKFFSSEEKDAVKGCFLCFVAVAGDLSQPTLYPSNLCTERERARVSCKPIN